MKTGLKKSQKTTEIFFDEASRWITVNTYNIDLKNRLTAYAKKHPDLCRLTDDYEDGSLSFEIFERWEQPKKKALYLSTGVASIGF